MSDTIGSRLASVRLELDKSQAEFAQMIDLSLGGIRKIEQDLSVPSGNTLLKIADLGISPTWILTGKGNKKLFAQKPYEFMPDIKLSVNDTSGEMHEFNMDLFIQISDLLQKVYREANVRLPAPAVARETMAAYVTLLDRAKDAAEQQTLIPWLEYHLKKGIESAIAEPGTGKREA